MPLPSWKSFEKYAARIFRDAVDWQYANLGISALLALVSAMLTVDQYRLATLFLLLSAAWISVLWWRSRRVVKVESKTEHPVIVLTDDVARMGRVRSVHGEQVIGVLAICGLSVILAYSINSKRTRQYSMEQLAQRSVDETTGGYSFCYVNVLWFGGSDLRATLLSKGTYPIFNVYVRVIDLDFISPQTELNSSFPYLQRGYETGAPGMGLFNVNPASSIESKRYSVFIIARNGSFTEELRVRRVGNKWASAALVSVSYYDNTRGIAFESIGSDFPIDSLASDTDWQAMNKVKRINIPGVSPKAPL